MLDDLSWIPGTNSGGREITNHPLTATYTHGMCTAAIKLTIQIQLPTTTMIQTKVRNTFARCNLNSDVGCCDIDLS